MSKLKEMKVQQQDGGGSILNTIIAGIAVLALLAIIYFFFFSPQPKFNLDDLEKGGHSKGGAAAKVRIVEFSDFQCPACGFAFPTVKRILSEYGDKIKFTYRHFPLTSIHPYAQKAAEASECAAEQGKFWEMHDLIFQNQEKLKLEDLKAYAERLGLDSGQFTQCLVSGKNSSKVAADSSYGFSVGIDSTPTFFINGEKYSGMSYEQFKAVIESKLRQ